MTQPCCHLGRTFLKQQVQDSRNITGDGPGNRIWGGGDKSGCDGGLYPQGLVRNTASLSPATGAT